MAILLHFGHQMHQMFLKDKDENNNWVDQGGTSFNWFYGIFPEHDDKIDLTG